MTYIVRIIVAINQFVNTLLGGYPDESLSSRAYRAELKGTRWGRLTRPLIDAIFFWDPSHCANAYRAEIARKHLPEAARARTEEASRGNR